jgi:hypothetical protein
MFARKLRTEVVLRAELSVVNLFNALAPTAVSAGSLCRGNQRECRV